MYKRSSGWINWLLAGCLLIPGFLPATLARSESRHSEPDPAQIKLHTDLVSLDVSVLDGLGRPVLGLTRDDFGVFEDGVQQEISFFSLDDSPLAVGLVLDSSGSMGRDSKLERARAAALHFVKTSHQDDEVFLVNFNSQAAVTLDFSSNLNAVSAALWAAKAKGNTALYDAVYLAVQKLNAYSTRRRKVILLITDGADTASRRSSKDIAELARESDVQIYAVGICGLDLTSSALGTITNFAEVTGGRAFFTMDSTQLVGICNWISIDLHQHYSLGYKPTNAARDGKWRKVKLKIKPRKHQPRLVVRTRQGYYAPMKS